MKRALVFAAVAALACQPSSSGPDVEAVNARLREVVAAEFAAWDAVSAALRDAAPAEVAAWEAAGWQETLAEIELEAAPFNPEDLAEGRNVRAAARARVRATGEALAATETALQAAAPAEFASMRAAEATHRAAWYCAAVEALRATAPAEFTAWEAATTGLTAARRRGLSGEWSAYEAKREALYAAREAAETRLRAAAPAEFAAWLTARRERPTEAANCAGSRVG